MHTPRPLPALLLAAAVVAGAPGCAALTNPVADGIPVCRLPDEVLGESREGLQAVPLNRLGQVPPDQYRLAAGDLLGVIAEGVLGERNAPVPVQTDREQGGPPALGYPVPVQDDGTIALPFVPPIRVAGLTLTEAQGRVVRALTEDRQILKKDTARVLVTLMRPRRYHVLVVREDAGQPGVPAGPGLGNGIGATLVGASRKGTGVTLELPAYENDVLNALTRSGGLPGTDAKNEVVVQRKPRAGGPAAEVRIPLRLRPGEPVPFRPEDVVLGNGDTVLVEAREAEVFYTAGLLGSGQYPLPRDYDLDVIQAIATVRGPLVSGGFIQGAFGGTATQSNGVGNPTPSLVTVLRPTCGQGQIPIRVDLSRAFRDRRERIRILPGDVIVLQETPEEAITRYLTQAFTFNFAAPVLRAGDLRGTGSLTVP